MDTMIQHSVNFPKQRVSSAEKNKPEWYQNCIDYVIDAGKVIQSYSYSTNKFTFTLSMKALTGNSNLGDMKLSLDLGEVGVGYDEDGKVKSALAFKSISNFSMNLVNIVVSHIHHNCVGTYIRFWGH